MRIERPPATPHMSRKMPTLLRVQVRVRVRVRLRLRVGVRVRVRVRIRVGVRVGVRVRGASRAPPPVPSAPFYSSCSAAAPPASWAGPRAPG